MARPEVQCMEAAAAACRNSALVRTGPPASKLNVQGRGGGSKAYTGVRPGGAAGHESCPWLGARLLLIGRAPEPGASGGGALSPMLRVHPGRFNCAFPLQPQRRSPA